MTRSEQGNGGSGNGAGIAGARLLVVGGQSRNVGKTALVVDLIRAFPEAAWTAVKITQYGHGVCAMNGESCTCAPRDHAVALDVETDPCGRSDTSRMLAAGARRAIWLRTKQGHLAEGLPLLRKEIGLVREGFSPHLIVESNSLVGFLSPRLYLVVLDPAVADFKPSARRFMDRADAFVIRGPVAAAGTPIEARRLRGRQAYRQELGQALPPELVAMVRDRFFGEGYAANG
jgi:molybdopterin-guanine dinucleotide biosynthesis protein